LTGGRKLQNEKKPFFIRLGSLTGHVTKKKLLLVIVAIAGISLALYFILGGTSKASGEYQTSTVKKGSIINSISASGTIEPVSTVSMSFKNAEVVKKIHVNVGDKVKKGQLLAELTTSNLETDVRQAKANLRSAQASLDALLEGATREEIDSAEADVSMAQVSYNSAKSNLERNSELYNAGALSKSELEDCEVEFTKAEAQLKQAKASLTTILNGAKTEEIAAAEAQVENARASLQESESDLEDAAMVSPVDGIVSEISGAEGQRASANNDSTSGEGFMEVISEEMQLESQVNESDIGDTKLGQEVEFTVNAYTEKIFRGRLDSIAPVAYAESNVQIYDVIIKLDEHYDELKAGMPADVTIIVEQSKDVLTIPKGAVTYAETSLKSMGNASGSRPQNGTGGQKSSSEESNLDKSAATDAARQTDSSAESAQGQRNMVLMLGKSGSPEPRQVELGLSDLTNYEVISGLNEGEIVITGSLSQTVETTSGETSTADKANNRGGQGMLGGPGGMPGGGPR
jgi:HlyD family secretion protein